MSKRIITAALGASIALLPLVGVQPAGATPQVAHSVLSQRAATTTASRAASTGRPMGRPATSSPKVNAPMLRPGMTGAAVTTLQQRLGTLGYWVGTPTGRYGHATGQAVMALQKVAGLGRDGVAGPATLRALDKRLMPRARSTRGRVLEIDLSRQVILLVVDGAVRTVINTSTGAAATPTPRGTYRVFRQVNRWHEAPLGKLYRPKYFYRGYAVHGVADGGIPGRPASHGCARVSTTAMDMLWKGGLRVGDTVRVY